MSTPREVVCRCPLCGAPVYGPKSVPEFADPPWGFPSSSYPHPEPLKNVNIIRTCDCQELLQKKIQAEAAFWERRKQ